MAGLARPSSRGASATPAVPPYSQSHAGARAVPRSRAGRSIFELSRSRSATMRTREGAGRPAGDLPPWTCATTGTATAGVVTSDAIERGDEERGPDKPPRRLLCRLGVHRWDKGHPTEDGRTYRTCRWCGEDEDDRPGPIGGYGGIHYGSN
jgi:hypothetical protein